MTPCLPNAASALMTDSAANVDGGIFSLDSSGCTGAIGSVDNGLSAMEKDVAITDSTRGDPNHVSDYEFLHENSADQFSAADDNVPGARASTIRIQSLWHCFPRKVFDAGTDFSRFYRAMHMKPQGGKKSPSTAATWPMPLPYHPQFDYSKSLGPDEISLRKAVNLQIACLDFLFLKKQAAPPFDICGAVFLNDAQLDVVKRFRRLMAAWQTHPAIGPEELGRTAGKQERQEQLLSSLEAFAEPLISGFKKYSKSTGPVRSFRQCDSKSKVVGSLKGNNLCSAQKIIASRIKMDGKPHFNPLPFLDDESKELYSSPFSGNIDPLDVDPPPPRVRVHADEDEKISLLHLLESSGRLGFKAPSEVFAGFGNGLFCVPKSTSVDRLILDGRPANTLQNPPMEYIMTMASATTLMGIHLSPQEKLLMTGDDLSNFFYTFQVGDERMGRNFLEWKIPIKIAKQFKSFPENLSGEKYVYACLRSLAMGDSAACSYAQTSHICMGLVCGAFTKDELVTLHGRIPRSPCIAGIIIDDFVLLEKVALGCITGPTAHHRRSKMHSMYSSVNLEAHPTKGFADAETASFWGADVDGVSGLVRANISRSASLVWITSRIATLGVSTIGLLEVLAGGFVSLFGFRRRLMSLLDLIYVDKGSKRREDIIRLPDSLVDELWSLVILSPLAVCDLRANFYDKIFMVDASSWGDAVVESPLPVGVASEIHRHCVTKSCWTKLLTPFKALQREKGVLATDEELPEEGVEFSEHPLWEVAARGLHYSLRWKKRAKTGRHINIGELRSYLKAESICASEVTDVRVPIGGDSQVTLGAVCKGRSASPALNSELRGFLAVQLGSGIYSSGGYVRSARNPADDPTRGARLRCPAVHLPDWWCRAGCGDYILLDELLMSYHLLPEQIAGYGDLNKLYMDKDMFGDHELKQKLNRHHRRIREKLKLRAAERSEDKNQLPEKVSKNDDKFSILSDDFRHSSSKGEQQNIWPDDILESLSFFGKEQFLLSTDQHWPLDTPGFLDLYSGQKGFAKQAIRFGAAWVLTVDIEDGPQCDLLKAEVRHHIEKLLRFGIFIHVSAAPICSSFSRAITPSVRSAEHPKGIPTMRASIRERVAAGNSHSMWLAKIINICITMQILWWVENPDTSYLWWQVEWKKIFARINGQCFRLDFCRFKTPWRKRTKIATTNRLAGVKMLCDGSHSHRVLRGRSAAHGQAWTKVAEPYPRRLCALLAHAVCADLQILRMKTRGACFTDSMRIGEASNPGPRRRTFVPQDVSMLDGVELIRPETVALGRTHWEKFCSWCKGALGDVEFERLWMVPALMGPMLAAYGRYWYSCGGALYCFRHLLVYGQRVYPSFKGNIAEAWNIVAKWEELEPVNHRRPVPLALMEAMVSIAISYGWIRFSATMLICFHGCARPGEVLKARRAHLVLPVDLGEDSFNPSFLRIEKRKPGRRGMGRVQHARIRSGVVTDFLQRHLGHLHGSVPIYPGSAACFRTRWNHILQKLQVPSGCKLTPGGMRAGGTVHLYKQGLGILDILWALRLRNVETLQHYLQEISTEITMIDLPFTCRCLILNFAKLFPHFISS